MVRQCKEVFAEQGRLAQGRTKDESVEMLLENRMEHVEALIACRRYPDGELAVSFELNRRGANELAPWMRRI